MKSKIVYSKNEETLFKQLQLIEESREYSDHSQEVSPEIILEQCAQVWGVEKSALIGKINHNKYDEKIMKLSLLFACRMFTNKDGRDIYSLFGYGKNLSYYRAGGDIILHLEYKNCHANKILSCFQSFVQLAPARFKALLQEAEQSEKQRKERSNVTTGLTMKDYIELLEDRIKWERSNADFYRELYMTELNRPNRIGKLLHQPLIGPNVTNMMEVIWQTWGMKKGAYVDRLDKNRIYEFEEVESGLRHLYDEFDEYLETFIEDHRN